MAQFRKYSKTYDKSNCPVAAITLKDFNISSIIKQIDYDNSILENSISYSSIQNLKNVNNKFTMTHYLPTTIADKHNAFLFTNKVNAVSVPMFYEYQLMFDAHGLNHDNDIQIYRNNIELVDKSKYMLEYTDDTLYENYISGNDPDNSRYGSSITWDGYNVDSNRHRVRILLSMDFISPNDFYTVRYNKLYLNIQNPNHLELLELKPLYDSTIDFHIEYDTSITSDIVTIITSKIDANKVNTLYCIKSPDEHIKVSTISEIISNGSMSQESSSWNIKISNGSFTRSTTIYDDDVSFYSTDYVGKHRYQVLSYIKPIEVGSNIVQVTDSPIYISDYTYPEYHVKLLPNVTNSNLLPKGSIGVNIDNDLIPDLKVIGIDRVKGFILFNNISSVLEDLALFYYTDLKYNTYIRNLELNPRVKSNYGFSNNSTHQLKDLGIAIRKMPHNIAGLNIKEYNTPYFFEFDKPTIFYKGEHVSTNADAFTVIGDLNWNPYNNKFDITGEFIPIAAITLNELGLNVINIHDARVIDGGLSDAYLPRLDNNQNNSYIDRGFYDGSLLPNDGIKIIHIPLRIYKNLINRWFNSNMFSIELYTDVTQYELQRFAEHSKEQDYYDNLILGKASNTEDGLKDSYINMKQKWAEFEAGYYLNQVINKYLPAGTSYILLDENFKQIKLRLEM